MKPDIIEFLKHGKENAVSMAEGAIFYDEPPRKFRARINEARRHGAVILSNPDKDRGGYYLPQDNAEIRSYLAFQQHRISK